MSGKHFLYILLQLNDVIYETHEPHPLWMESLIIYVKKSVAK